MEVDNLPPSTREITRADAIEQEASFMRERTRRRRLIFQPTQTQLHARHGSFRSRQIFVCSSISF